MNLQQKEIKVKLTDDPLENIKLMAPLLSKREQENVFFYVLGLYDGANNTKDLCAISKEKEPA